jgi:putative ABC transport system ATP-binding protein
LRALHGDGTTVIVITHDLGIASAMPRCIELRDGQVVGDTADPNVPLSVAGRL